MTDKNKSADNVTFSRRALVKGAAASGAAAVVMSSQSRASSESDEQFKPGTIKPFIIDVHHHAVPDIYVDEMNRQNYVPSHGKGFPKWTPQSSLNTMDQYGIAASVTSVSSPGVYVGSAKKAVALSRMLNEHSAKVRQQYDRLGFFAILPLPITEAAIGEAIYALDELGADGIVLLASSGDQFLGDPDLEELMSELDKRETVVFVHPNIHSTSDALPLDIPGFYLEFMFDTTRAVTNMIYSGTLERYKRIKWIIAHAGATLPYLTWRLSLVQAEDPSVLERAPRGVKSYLQSLHYDTALSPTRYSMASLLELVEPTQIMFGSDFPFAPDPLVGVELQELYDNPLLDDKTTKMIMRDNALRLFPRFASSGEMPMELSSHNLLDHPKVPWAKRFILRQLKQLVGE